MGWTGCRKEEFSDIKDFVNEYISQYVNKPEHKLKKSVKKRTEFFYLINSSGEDWILKIITQTKREKKFFRVVNKQEKEDGTCSFSKTNKIVTREIYNASESNNLGNKPVNQ